MPAIILLLFPICISGMVALLIPKRLLLPIFVNPEKQTFGLIKLNFPIRESCPTLERELITVKSPIVVLGPRLT